MNSETFDSFMQRMLNSFPEATVEQDNEGQLVIYTGLKLTEDDEVTPFEAE